MKSDRSYIPLWVKSNYSFLQGASHPDELMYTAARLGLPALALTDRDGVYGVVQAHSAAKEIRDTGTLSARHTVQFTGDSHERPGGNASTPVPVDPASGWGTSSDSSSASERIATLSESDAEAAAPLSTPRLITGSEMTVQIEPGVARSVVLLAEDRDGYGRLCNLVSRGRMRSPKGESVVTLDEVCGAAGGLVALWTGARVSAPEIDLDVRLNGSAIGDLADAFAQSLYLVHARHMRSGEQAEFEQIKALSREYRLPVVAATEVLYHAPEKRELYDVVTCIRHGVTLDEAGSRLKPNGSYSLLSTDEMFERYRDVPSIVHRSLEIGERCSFSLDEINYRYPNERVPEGYTTFEWLRELTFAGAKQRYEGDIPPKVRTQLQKELSIIDQLQYAGYFLTMWEIVEYCRREGILAQGRGSAANSAVCFCLHVTAIDPVRMDLLFERFLSLERAEPPDIDLDIEHRRREEVIQHMYDKYGREKAAMVANVIRYRIKSSIRDVGKVLDFPATTLDRMAKIASSRDSNLEEVLNGAGIGKHARDLFGRLAQELLDFPRHLSIHPGGFLLGSEPVHHLVPIENATMPDRTVIQWDKNDIEEMGLFKVDLLGLGALTHLDYCFALLKRYRAIDLSMAKVPENDPAVYEMLCRGDTVGVFQLESRAQMSMLPRLRPKNWYDIVIEVSIVRPGPISGGMVHPYLRRRAGEEDVVYAHDALKPVLRKTLGVPIFQEQVMKLAVVAADYTPGEADQLRRDMAAWRRSGRIEQHHERFVQRMIAKGIKEEFAEAVFSQIRGFGEYGFPESHAASFSLIAYCTAWMRAHFPAEFICGLLNAWPMGFYSPASIVEDAKRHGIEMRPIDVLKSEWECTLEPIDQVVVNARRAISTQRGGKDRGVDEKDSRSMQRAPWERPIDTADAAVSGSSAIPDGDARYTSTKEFAVRMGLRYVRGINEVDYQRIKDARQEKKLDMERFIQKTNLNEDLLVALARAGAFCSLGLDRRQALWEVSGQSRRRENELQERKRVGDASNLMPAAELLPSFRSLEELELVAWDYHSSSHSVQAHPIKPHREALAAAGHPNAEEIWRTDDGARTSYVGVVIARQRPGTAGGVTFVTLEDESGYVNLIIWKKVYDQYRTVLITSSVLGVEGNVQAKDGVVHLVVDHCFKPTLSIEGFKIESRDFR